MEIVTWLLNKLNGWKTIIGVILAQIPWLTDHPLLIEAIKKFLADMDNPTAIGNLVIQILIAIGVLHRIVKNLSDE